MAAKHPVMIARLPSPAPVLAGLAMAVALAGCADNRASGPPVPNAPSALAGRWTLSSPGAGSCAMTFGGGPSDGTIAPEGGCPGNFFTSRKWAIERGDLVLRNHLGETLAQLKPGDGARYDGQSTAGQAVTLSR
jgi:Protease inhibitor Inh